MYTPCNSPTLSVKKPKRKGWRFIQDLRAIDKVVILRYLVVPSSHKMLLSAILVDLQYFPVMDLGSAFSSIPIERDSQYFLAFTWEVASLLGLKCPRGIQRVLPISPRY